jgi:hypothetical protein
MKETIEISECCDVITSIFSQTLTDTSDLNGNITDSFLEITVNQKKTQSQKIKIKYE